VIVVHPLALAARTLHFAFQTVDRSARRCPGSSTAGTKILAKVGISSYNRSQRLGSTGERKAHPPKGPFQINSWEARACLRTRRHNESRTRPIERLVEYPRNPRKNDKAVDRMCASIRESGFKIPVPGSSGGEIVDGHLRPKAARKLGIEEIPVILCDEWTPAQVKTFRLMVNRSGQTSPRVSRARRPIKPSRTRTPNYLRKTIPSCPLGSSRSWPRCRKIGL
jgi:ParB-like nuclease domain